MLLLGVALRIFRLDADPHYYEWIGYITDEGRWTDRARELALFGRTLEPLSSLHVLVAPLFQLGSYLVFALSGVSVASSRALSAVSGCFVLVVFWAAFRGKTTPHALLLALVPLAVQVDLLTLSRVAVPEAPVIALELLLYLAVTSGASSGLAAFGTGLLALATLGMKITALPAVAILSAIHVWTLASSGSPGRGRRIALFAAGCAGPALVAGLALLAVRPELARVLASASEVLLTFVRVSVVTDVIAFPFADALVPELALWGLAVWYGLLGWWVANASGVDPAARRHLRASVVWASGYLVVMLLAGYFPNRYKVHVLLPMCVTVAVGVGLLQRTGVAGAETALTSARAGRRLAGWALLGLPTAILLAPLLVSLAGLVGLDPFRLRLKLAALVVSLAGSMLAMRWLARRGRPLAVFLLFPALATFAWFLGQRAGNPETTFWPTPESPATAWLRLAPLAAAVVLAILLAVKTRGGPSLAAGIALGAAGYALLACFLFAPGYLDPHYSIRDTSRQLGRLLAGYSGIVATSGADGLFRENTLPFTTVWGRHWPATPPEVLVLAFGLVDPHGILARDYCQIAEYPIYAAPSYYRANPIYDRSSALGEAIRVHLKRPSPRCPDPSPSAPRGP